MNGMFQGCLAFNINIGNWITTNVRHMGSMFYQATSFNQPIGQWDVSKVTNTEGMFGETPFNQDIGKWDVSKLVSANAMFIMNSAFDNDISTWNIISLEMMNQMMFGVATFSKIMCSEVWLAKQALVGASNGGPGMMAASSRVFCCEAGSFLENKNPSTFTGSFTYDDNNGETVDTRVWAVHTVNDCPKCPAGQYTGSYNLAATCQQCPRDTNAPTAGLTACAICSDGTFSNDGLSCSTCGAGKFTSSGTSTTTCDACVSGKFQEDGTKDQCFDCPSGWYQADVEKPFCLPCIRKYPGYIYYLHQFFLTFLTFLTFLIPYLPYVPPGNRRGIYILLFYSSLLKTNQFNSWQTSRWNGRNVVQNMSR
jgi:surface protein